MMTVTCRLVLHMVQEKGAASPRRIAAALQQTIRFTLEKHHSSDVQGEALACACFSLMCTLSPWLLVWMGPARHPWH